MKHHCKTKMLQLILLLAAVCSWTVRAWDQQPDGYEVIDGPLPLQDVDEWRHQWATWRDMELKSVRYDASDKCNVYNIETAQWTQRNFVQVLLMLHDRDIFDRDTNSYTVDKYVKTMEARVGKLDSVLLWPAYPNSGIDNRNQWDFLRTSPGGLDGLRQLISDFHARDIRIVLPYNPWDTATRDEVGLEDTVRMYTADIQTINEMLPLVGADGFNGDTMYGVPKAFYNCSAPTIATPEGGVPSAYLSHNPISWGYFFGYENFPPVARAKFLEPRHMVQVCARWSLDKLAELQTAFFNGVGYVVWENVWGIWNAMTDRESEATKRIFHVLRAFADFTVSPTWRPYVFRASKDQVFASAFPHPTQEKMVIYTIINVATEAHTIKLPLSFLSTATAATSSNGAVDSTMDTSAARVFDVFHGHELAWLNGTNEVELTMEPRGFGAILVASKDPTTVLPQFLKYMEERRLMAIKPLHEYANTRALLRQEMTRIASSSSSATVSALSSQRQTNAVEAATPPKDMVLVTGQGAWWFNVTGVHVEPVVAWTPNWAQFGVGVQFPWEDRPWTNHSVRLDVRDFYIDQDLVTNEQFRDFVIRAEYTPRVLERFLDHWGNRKNAQTHNWNPVDQWTIPLGMDKSPVVFVSIEDARAYAAFHNKRLPHDWEWQFVASNGAKYTRFPWGNENNDSTRLPPVSREKTPRLPDAVGSFPKSDTLTGVHDLVGLVWQMTDQFCDAHTCGTLLRGGSYYRPVASTHSDPNWYFPQAYDATQHNRFLTLSESYDRSALVGFRCAQSVVVA